MFVKASPLTTLLLLTTASTQVLAAPSWTTPCNTVVIGGGIGGLYSAVHLASPSNSVCVFERENRLGGRIDDVVLDNGIDPIGLGAWRFDDNHDKVFSLAQYYGIAHRPWNRVPKYIESRGIVAQNTTDLLERAFPKVKAQYGDADFLGELMADVQSDLQAKGMQGASVYDYIMKKYGSEVHAYMAATNGGFTGDLYAPDALSYFAEFLPAEFTDSGNQNRPFGGMSEFIRKLAADASAKGVKIYLREGVNELSATKTPGMYTVRTSKRTVQTSKMVINVPPAALKNIKGSLADRLKAHPTFKSILPGVAFKSASYFKEPFWASVLGPLEQYIPGSTCLGQFLPYPGKGPNGESILHTAYADGPCAEKFWAALAGKSESDIWEEIKKQLQAALKAVDPSIVVPEPIKTVSQFWKEGAWHWQVAGSNVSMAQVQEWASNPLAGEPVYLANEAYGERRTWAQGALTTAQNGLERLGVTPRF